MEFKQLMGIANEGLWNALMDDYADLYTIKISKTLKEKDSKLRYYYVLPDEIFNRLFQLDPDIIEDIENNLIVPKDDDYVPRDIHLHIYKNALCKAYHKGYRGRKLAEEFIYNVFTKGPQLRNYLKFKKTDPSNYNRLVNVVASLLDEKYCEITKKDK